jgi:hypothetical protein
MENFTGTKPVSEQHAFDVGGAAVAPRAASHGFAGPLSVEQFKGGQSNPTYKLVTPSAAYVMRSKPAPAAKLLPSAHAIEREYRVMHALRGHGRARAAHAPAVRGRVGDRARLLRDVIRARAAGCGTADAPTSATCDPGGPRSRRQATAHPRGQRTDDNP